MPSTPPDDSDEPPSDDTDERSSEEPSAEPTREPTEPPGDELDNRLSRAKALCQRRLWLVAVPAVASLVSISNLIRALNAGPGGGVTFPLPSGLPTVWTYASLPGQTTPVATGVGGLLPGVAVFLVGAVFVGVLEAGLLGTLAGLADGADRSFAAAASQHAVPVVAARLLVAGIVFVTFPVLLVVPAVALLIAPLLLVVTYVVYGLPFVIVVERRQFRSALDRTLQLARGGGDYARFAVAHLVAGAAVSVPVSSLIRGGLPGVAVALALTAPVGLFVAAYGVLVFRELGGDPSPPTPT